MLPYVEDCQALLGAVLARFKPIIELCEAHDEHKKKVGFSSSVRATTPFASKEVAGV
jgi:hypothetical protein